MTLCAHCKRPLAGPFVGGMGEPAVPRGSCSSFEWQQDDECREVAAAYRRGVRDMHVVALLCTGRAAPDCQRSIDVELMEREAAKLAGEGT